MMDIPSGYEPQPLVLGSSLHIPHYIPPEMENDPTPIRNTEHGNVNIFQIVNFGSVVRLVEITMGLVIFGLISLVFRQLFGSEVAFNRIKT